MLFNYIELRRYFHMHPELSFEENDTADKIKTVLKALDIPYSDKIAKTGIMATLNGSSASGKTVVIRADMDALPIKETNDCDYKSLNDGIMHACGHDVHIATVLCAAEKLMQKREHLKGCVKFLFQPGEETTGGALPMIEAGILENPKADICVGFHVKPELDTGKIICKPGKLMASPDEFHVTLRGNGGHCAYPTQNDDLLKIGAELLLQLKSLSYPDAIVVPCVITAGSAYNVMPSELNLSGSFRTFDSKTRNDIAEQIKKMTEAISKKYSIESICDILLSYPPLHNDIKSTMILQKSASKLLGPDNVITDFEPCMLGEDFAYFGQYVPAVYFYLGTKIENKQTVLHADNFDVDESAIEIGANVLEQFVLDYLK